jgi:hypothetical protein
MPAFDISPYDDAGFAALVVGGVSGLYHDQPADRRGPPDRADRHRARSSTASSRCRWRTSSPRDRRHFFDTDILLANPTRRTGAGDRDLPDRAGRGDAQA